MDFTCAECLEVTRENGHEFDLPEQRNCPLYRKGRERNPNFHFQYQHLDEGADCCPRGLITDEAAEVLELFNALNDYGALPNAGGVLDQDPFVFGLIMEARKHYLNFQRRVAPRSNEESE